MPDCNGGNAWAACPIEIGPDTAAAGKKSASASRGREGRYLQARLTYARRSKKKTSFYWARVATEILLKKCNSLGEVREGIVCATAFRTLSSSGNAGGRAARGG